MGPKNSEITVGTRFRLGALGAARSPRLAEKEGTVIGGGRYKSTVRVRFDGFKYNRFGAIPLDYGVAKIKRGLGDPRKPSTPEHNRYRIVLSPLAEGIAGD